MGKTRVTVGAAVAVGATAALVAGIAAAGTAKSTYSYKATMTPSGETPKPKAPAGAKGGFSATVTENGAVRTLKWRITFSGLSGTAVGAHIHKGKAGVAGPVLVALCGPCRNGQTGTTQITKDAADVLESGGAYVNVHTAKNQGGEVRGQVKLVGDTAKAVSGGTQTTPSGGSGPTGSSGGGGYDGY